MATDIEKTGIEFKVLAALSPASWNKLSFWSRAQDVHFADDTNGSVQDYLGSIKGITSDPNSVSQSLVASAYLVNYTSGEKVSVQLDAAGWSGSKTTVSGVDYYTYVKDVSKIILAHPEMYLDIDTVPTEEMTEAWNALHMVADTVNNKLTFYIEDKPEMNIKIGIKGVVI